MKLSLCLPLLALVAATTTHALVLANNPTGNTSAPTGTNGQPTDPGFANIGSVNGSSGVYLGDGWVLTARHVGAGNFTTGTNTTYQYQSNTVHNIAGTDLTLFKLTSTPPELASLTLSTSSPALNSGIVMIAAGRTATTSTPTHYYVDTSGTNPNNTPKWTWSTTDFEGADDSYEGFLTDGNKAVRWGTNVIAGHGFDTREGSASIGHYFATSFDLAGGTSYEAQAVRDDSGGAAFFFDGTQWRLAGIIVSVGLYPNQPLDSRSAFDGNITFIVDLAKYTEQINSVIPEPSTYALLTAAIACAFLLRRNSRSREKARNQR